ncbi:MAG: hypothetical protein GTO18_16875 [Anaerolineales bacterium]|nr:hypothetical protein [Anaerolineales bacterium]
MANGYCPECDANINLGKSFRKGQVLTCYKCGTRLVIAKTSPIELDWSFQEDSDDEQDFEYDDGYDYENLFQNPPRS